jgi:hypothetical protein
LSTRLSRRILIGFATAAVVAATMTSALAGVAQAGTAAGHSAADKQQAAPMQVTAADAQRVVSGRTPPGWGWNTYVGPAAPGIWIQVNTTAAGFITTPTYVTSVGGNSAHWHTTGASAVYPPDANLGGDLRRGFRIFLRYSDNSSITPTDAWNNQWYVNWIATV